MGSKGSTTTNSAQSYTPNAVAPISYALQTAINASQTPYQNYNGELTAGLQPQQQAGMTGINQYANAAQPYIQNAQNYINQGAQNPLQNVQQYMNPYTQSVVDATQNQFNASNQTQQSQLLGNAAASGALGGDRAAVAQADLAKQQNLAQNPVISGLYSTGFNNAVTAAQTQQNALFNAGYGTGSLGTAAQNAGLQGASAQIQGGTLAQQTQQAQDTANYNEFLRQAGYPFQASQFLTQATAGLAPSLGGSGVGVSQTTPAQPSLIGQLTGLGLTGAGLYNSLGGSKGSKGATGGGLGSTIGGSAAALGLNRGGAVGGFASGGQVSPGLGMLEYVLPMAKAIRDHLRAVPVTQPDGIIVPRAGFADGGSPDFDSDFGAFATPPDATPENRALALALAQKYDPVDPITLNAGAPLPRPRPDEAPANPDAVAGPDDPSALPAAAEPTAGLTPPGGLPTDTPQSPTNGSEWANTLRQAIAGVGDYKPQASSVSPLVAAGLGMLASGSPFPGVAIGKGGLEGLSAVEKAQANQRADATTQANLALHKGTLASHGLTAEQAAARLVQEAKQHAASLAQQQQIHSVPTGYRQTPEGTLEAVPGGPQDPATIRADAVAKRTPGMSDEALGQMVQSYRTGNTGILTGVGRGIQGADNLNRFWNIMSDQLKSEGLTGKDLAAAKANFTAQSAAARTAAVRETQVANAVEEAKNTFPLALQRSSELPRTQFVPWNKAVQAVQSGTSSPELARFVTANQAVITAYSQAMSRTGVNTVHAQQHAENLLNTATSQEAYSAVIGQMQQEMDAALTAPETVKKKILNDISGRTNNPQSATATKPQGSPTGPRAIPDTVRQNDHTYQKQQDGSYKAID